MREIKFRGFHEHKDGETVITINGEKKRGTWVYGVPIKTKIGIFIIDEENPHYCSQYFYMEIQMPKLVIPETVGQFTGLRDKNGKEIYDGDIVVFESVFSKDKFVGRVMYYSGCKPILWDGKHSIDLAETNGEDLEIRGNIYEDGH